MKLKLEIELVPSTAWYSNLRTKVSKQEWDGIRKQCYAEHGYKCRICGARGRLNCHEIWEYSSNRVQTLKGFIALCDDCHMVKHMGFANIQSSRGLLDMDKLIRHFIAVNGVDRNAFEQHEKEAFALWTERSRHNWKIDLSGLPNMIKEKGNGAPGNTLKAFLAKV